MNLQRCLTMAISVLVMGCGFGSYPDKNGSYTNQFPTTPLSNQVCQEDKDCVATPYRDGTCCPDTCQPELNVFNTDTFAQLRAHQEEICAEGAFECATVSACELLPYDQRAVCSEGYCRIERYGHHSKPPKGKADKAKAKGQKAGKRKAKKQKAKKQKASKRQ